MHRIVVLLLCLFALGLCDCRPKTLPHRQEWELFRQANSPSKDCPGQYPIYVGADDGTAFFLECFGHRGEP
jgi:hypothetical protein